VLTIKKKYLDLSKQKTKTMTKDLINNLFFNPKEELKTKHLNADLVEATINQLIAELKEQEMRNEKLIVDYKKNDAIVDEALTEGVNNGLRIALLHLRKLYADIIWKQLTLKNNETND